MLLLHHSVYWVLFTLRRTCLNKVNFGTTVKSKNQKLSNTSIVCVMWCKSEHLWRNWDLDQSFLTGIEMQHFFKMVIHWLNSRKEQAVDYVTVQSLVSFPENCISPTRWNFWNFWTLNTQFISILQVLKIFSHQFKILFLLNCPKEFLKFLCDCIVNLLKGNLQVAKDITWQNIKTNFRLLSLREAFRYK